jgi:hypothetical protein
VLSLIKYDFHGKDNINGNIEAVIPEVFMVVKIWMECDTE